MKIKDLICNNCGCEYSVINLLKHYVICYYNGHVVQMEDVECPECGSVSYSERHLDDDWDDEIDSSRKSIKSLDDYAARKRGLTNSRQIKSGHRQNRYNNSDFNNDKIVFDYDTDNISVDEDIPFASEPIDPAWVGAEEHDKDYYHYRDMGRMYGSGVRSSKEFSDKDSSWEDLMDDSDWDFGNPESYEVRDKDFGVSFKTTNKQEAEEFYNIHPESFYLIEYLEHGDRIIKSKDKDMIESSDEILSGFDKNKDSLSKLF